MIYILPTKHSKTQYIFSLTILYFLPSIIKLTCVKLTYNCKRVYHLRYMIYGHLEQSNMPYVHSFVLITNLIRSFSVYTSPPFRNIHFKFSRSKFNWHVCLFLWILMDSFYLSYDIGGLWVLILKCTVCSQYLGTFQQHLRGKKNLNLF